MVNVCGCFFCGVSNVYVNISAFRLSDIKYDNYIAGHLHTKCFSTSKTFCSNIYIQVLAKSDGVVRQHPPH